MDITYIQDDKASFERMLKKAGRGKYVFRLFVTGTTSKSIRAIRHMKAFCEAYLPGRYTLEVVDIYQQPGLAKQEQILAAPTLIKELPMPLRRLIGDLTDTNRVLLALDLPDDLEDVKS